MTSLRRRLNRLVVVLLGGMALQWFLADRMIVHVTESEMATRLEHDLDSLLATLNVGHGGAVDFDARVAGTIYERPYSGHYFVLRVNGREFHSASFGDARPFAIPSPAQGSLDHLDGPRDQSLLALTTGFEVDGRSIALTVAEDLTPLQRELLAFRLLFIALSLAVMIAALVLQRRELRIALAPLEEVRDAVLKIQQGARSRVAVDVPDEIRPLAAEIDRLLGFVERRLLQSRTALGNLSHALKTPLTAVMRMLDDPRMAALPDLRSSIGEHADAIRARIERELARARLAGDQPSAAHFDPAAELPVLVRLLERIHEAKRLDIRWSAPAGTVPFDRQDLLELIGNLADNACKWAASRVRIDIGHDDGLRVVVADDGPGCPPETLAALATRGQRLDETVPGHGLGLAIARDIVRFAGGSLGLGRSASLGGLEVVATFPR